MPNELPKLVIVWRGSNDGPWGGSRPLVESAIDATNGLVWVGSGRWRSPCDPNPDAIVFIVRNTISKSSHSERRCASPSGARYSA